MSTENEFVKSSSKKKNKSSKIQSVLLNILRTSENIKFYRFRWKWRRTRMYQIITIYLPMVFLLSASFLPCTFTFSLNSRNNHRNQQRLQTILDGLTPHEGHLIFGSSNYPKTSELSTLDLIQPQIFHRNHRKKGSRESTEEDIEEKVIKLSGLGRLFHFKLTRNHHLLNFNNFVHLFRHENHSEILSDEIIRRQLHCFHHGSVSHQRQDQQDNQIKDGLVSLDICNGLTGFIIPIDNDPEHHYVIHTVPKRLTSDILTDPDPRNNDFVILPESFIWKKQKVDPTSENFYYIPPEVSRTTCGHKNENEKFKLGHSHQSNIRTKRSHITSNEDSSDQFHYKPRNVAGDSYWFRYRTTVSPHHKILTNHDEFNSRSESTNSYPNIYLPRHTPVSSNDRQMTTDSYQITQPSSNRHHDTILGRSGNGYSNQVTFHSTSRSNNENYQEPVSSWTNYIDKYNYYNTSSPVTLVPSSGLNFKQKDQWIPTTERKARRDDNIFGENWYSFLDSDIMATASTFPQPSTTIPKEPSHLTIEIAVFVDADLFDHIRSNFPDDTQAEVARIVLAMINAVQLIYKNPSLGHRIDFVVKRLEILKSDPPGLSRHLDIDMFLTNFCKFQKMENPSTENPLHWDHALILTGLDLYVVHQSGKSSNQVVGLAPVAGMCTKSSSCTVNEGRHFESVYVMAHEIGHNIGMRHDGANNECDPTSHLMSPTLGSGKATWSSCSRQYLEMFLETSQSKCLLNRAKSDYALDHNADGRLPGERFNADQQCILKYGRGSFHAPQQPIEDVCRDLHCRKQYYTWTSHPALEGTDCGHEMSCRGGTCVPKVQIPEIKGSGTGHSPSLDQPQMNNHLGGMDGSETAAYSTLKAIDGTWGPWTPYTDCSSTCLYDDTGLIETSTGIRLAARRCDSPRPENGGRQCSGLDRKYKTCKTDKICLPTSPRTTISQYATSVCARAATVDTELTGRGFMSSVEDAERACSVWCETTQGIGSSRGWSFPDGTACLTSRLHGSHFCVAGKCQEFTCDLSSHFTLSEESCNLVSNTGTKIEASWFDNNYGSDQFSENYRTSKTFSWSKWESASSCKLTGCVVPGKGLELVQRKCNSPDQQGIGNSVACSGLALSVRLCKPDKSAILANGCSRPTTIFEYATKLCKKYSERVSGLSGIGMQLSPTTDDSNRPCRVGCQDSNLPYRFYMVNGDEGFFPPGTDCSRGLDNKKSYCLNGKCIDFGTDDTPFYRINTKVIGRLESILRTRRELVQHNLMDQGSLQKLIDEFTTGGKYTGINTDSNTNHLETIGVDFSRPIAIDEKQYNSSIFDEKQYEIERQSELSSTQYATYRNRQIIESEGSFYEWRRVMLDCSVSCGNGLQEALVQCISGDTVVIDTFCQVSRKPGSSGYVPCQNRPCTELDDQLTKANNLLWKWIQSIMSKQNKHSVLS